MNLLVETFCDSGYLANSYLVYNDKHCILIDPANNIKTLKKYMTHVKQISNSNKQYMEQIRIAKDVVYSRSQNEDIKRLVKGLMIESYIEDDCQKPEENVYGKSITDPCLGWKDTEELLYKIADLIDEMLKFAASMEFEKAAEIRDKIKELGYTIKDSKDGYELEKI